jgi:hypothetical protein
VCTPQDVFDSTSSERMRQQRMKTARELLETEENYVKMLEAMIDTIIRPCMGQGGSRRASPLTPQEGRDMFGVLKSEELLAINTALRNQASSPSRIFGNNSFLTIPCAFLQLRGRMKNLDYDTCFGDLFVRFAPFLKMYVEYCTQHESTASRVGLMATKNDRFRAVLRKSAEDPRCQGADAQSLLIMPIQVRPSCALLPV